MAESKEITVDQSKIQSLQMERSVTVFQVAPDTSVDLTSSELLLSKFFVEFIAMTLFVFIGCGAAVSTSVVLLSIHLRDLCMNYIVSDNE
mmetsp:Transcript_9674/g.15617  ORF Transcript_9674/g.15617 Transcript_9674/m.15617 type:complete len:90 (+) Transcript_9674:89-358(+)